MVLTFTGVVSVSVTNFSFDFPNISLLVSSTSAYKHTCMYIITHLHFINLKSSHSQREPAMSRFSRSQAQRCTTEVSCYCSLHGTLALKVKEYCTIAGFYSCPSLTAGRDWLCSTDPQLCYAANHNQAGQPGFRPL